MTTPVLEKRHFCSNSFHLFDRIVLMLHDLNHWLFFFLSYELFNIMNYRENSYILINYCIVSKFLNRYFIGKLRKCLLEGLNCTTSEEKKCASSHF